MEEAFPREREEALVNQNTGRPIAWVESPLQFIAAAEWAFARGEHIDVAFRLTGVQMSRTAEELLKRGARFVSCAPYYGIPWQLLSQHREWAVGDAFSGQFRLAGALRPPRKLTLLDDGTMTLAVADSLLGRIPFGRPGQRESAIHRKLGTLVRDRMLGMAARERLDLFTGFALGHDRLAKLGDRGIRVSQHRLDWVRSTARPIAVPGNRVLLGSALPVDGRMSLPRYLAWVAAEASVAGLAYLPHRRETAATLAAVAAIPGVRVFNTGLPIELVLAGARESLEVVTLPTSAETTLGWLLEGSGSVIRKRSLELHPSH
jgi:hypothetical protein